ncbi:MAG: M56 family metallopeptidase, partial [Terriglobales bacterium]
MFALRGAAVSLTFFVLLYCFLSALVALAWRGLKLLRVTQRGVAALLFGLRVLPLAASAVVTFAFVVPSFQLLEPRSINEGLGVIPFVLGICAVVLIVWGGFRVIAAQAKTARVVARWLEGARPLNADVAVQEAIEPAAQAVTFRSRRETPPLTLVGVTKPRVLVSESTVSLLSDDELHIALKHEFAHMKSRDNLKKLIFRCCPFPGMAKLESSWSQAAELAADDAAVSNLDDAVDLASALV